MSLLLSLISLVVVICTLLIGLLWLIPFYAVFWAAFYESVKRPPVVLYEAGPAELPAAENPDQGTI